MNIGDIIGRQIPEHRRDRGKECDHTSVNFLHNYDTNLSTLYSTVYYKFIVGKIIFKRENLLFIKVFERVLVGNLLVVKIESVKLWQLL